MSGVVRKALNLHRNGDSDQQHACSSSKDKAVSLNVITGGGTRWILPWTYFVVGMQQVLGKAESLVLTFVSMEVTIRGRNLDRLAEDAGLHRLATVREGSGDYFLGTAKEPFVEKILVQPRRENPAQDG